jgi:hypothetical protein
MEGGIILSFYVTMGGYFILLDLEKTILCIANLSSRLILYMPLRFHLDIQLKPRSLALQKM